MPKNIVTLLPVVTATENTVTTTEDIVTLLLVATAVEVPLGPLEILIEYVPPTTTRHSKEATPI